jgi:hypothetical protein
MNVHDKEYINSMKSWFKTMDAGVKKTKSIIKGCDEDTKRNNEIAKTERAHLKLMIKRIDLARKDYNNFLKNHK